MFGSTLTPFCACFLGEAKGWRGPLDCSVAKHLWLGCHDSVHERPGFARACRYTRQIRCAALRPRCQLELARLSWTLSRKDCRNACIAGSHVSEPRKSITDSSLRDGSIVGASRWTSRSQPRPQYARSCGCLRTTGQDADLHAHPTFTSTLSLADLMRPYTAAPSPVHRTVRTRSFILGQPIATPCSANSKACMTGCKGDRPFFGRSCSLGKADFELSKPVRAQ